jgi:hypothetical protein
LRSFETKVKRIGIDPTEITLFNRMDPSQSYEERARQTWVLIDCGVLGDHRREPQLNREALEILFQGMARSMDLEVARSLGGPIQWDFTDAEPWHLVVANDHAEAKLGKVDNAALRLEASSAEMAKIAVGRTDPRWALLKRKLKVHGALGAKAKLPRLFT